MSTRSRSNSLDKQTKSKENNNNNNNNVDSSSSSVPVSSLSMISPGAETNPLNNNNSSSRNSSPSTMIPPNSDSEEKQNDQILKLLLSLQLSLSNVDSRLSAIENDNNVLKEKIDNRSNNNNYNSSVSIPANASSGNTIDGSINSTINYVNINNPSSITPSSTGINTIAINGKKIPPIATNELSHLPIDDSYINARIFGNSKTDITELTKYLHQLQLPHYPTLDLSTLSFTPFKSDMNASDFIDWQEVIITQAKQFNINYYIVNNWKSIVEKIKSKVNSNTSLTEEVINGVIIKLYDLIKIIYYKLRLALKDEKIVTTNIDNLIKLYSRNNDIFLDGNINYLWRSLDYYYEQISAASITQLEQQFTELSYTGAISREQTALFLNSIDKFRTKFAKFNINKSDSTIVDKVKRTIPVELAQLLYSDISKITTQYDELRKIIVDGTEEYCRLHIDSNSINAAFGYQREGRQNYNSNNNNYNQNNFSSNKTKPHCTKCNKEGHSTNQHYDCNICGKSHQKGKCRQQKQQQSSNTNNVEHTIIPEEFAAYVEPAAFTYELIDNEEKCCLADSNGNYTNAHRECILDSGCSVHICCNPDLLINVEEIPPIQIRLPDGKAYTVYKAGTMMLTPKFHITKVLYIPSFSTNLISVGRILKLHEQFKLIISNNKAKLTYTKDNLTVPVLEAPLEGALYVLRLPKGGYKPTEGALNSEKMKFNSLLKETKEVNKAIGNKATIKVNPIPKKDQSNKPVVHTDGKGNKLIDTTKNKNQSNVNENKAANGNKPTATVNKTNSLTNATTTATSSSSVSASTSSKPVNFLPSPASAFSDSDDE